MPERSTSNRSSPATDFSIALLNEFVRLGVRDLVLCPGARSQALALAAAELERVGSIRLHVRTDERSAGFLSVGLALETGLPALVAVTSGTAVANLHPAVLEAHHAGVPMILLTADRPAELRGIRSNQTTVQSGLFGVATRLCLDVPAPVGEPDEVSTAVALARQAMDAATGVFTTAPGPAQLNLAFREPLSAALPAGSSFATPAIRVAPATSTDGPAMLLAPGPRTVVVAGDGAGPAAEELAHAGGWPLLAEVSSGARFGPNLIVHYRELLSAVDLGGQVERVIVFGHPTLSREIPALIKRDGVETIVVAPTGLEWYNPGHTARGFTRSIGADASCALAARTPAGRAWLGRWIMTSRALAEAAADEGRVPIDKRGITRAELAALRAPLTRALLVDAVWRASWPHDRLVLGASRLIREADKRVPGKKIPVLANRGLAGIDGTIATALGVALASQAEPEPRSVGVTRVLMGDLTFLHDVGSLLIAPGEPQPRLQVIVGVDGGGSIFDGLEVAATAPAEAMERVLYTPRSVDLKALAAAYGWDYEMAATRSDLERALTGAPTRPAILEVPLVR
ncbi:MAG: 2-succinyl-5-enolpyruvyl-6-hydroxy-3-cyclohexene-1-carboxylic-acid synthase [Cryobacterium sp.]|uniref:2-succinyl-5-enolpyruvyl-6-hydroxy-3- cyclohexene-1-carboxylic-acid synthase n=1 Tax=unclassified Cryobacterium TaxID=2649013 RepID=UPI0018C9A2FE|nr:MULTISPECIES: 2-succinyl-5-enolpyruvyl-6-hydroxy-3-cyclohexene-1-carboxylic-acid synthase [unclassified Cryobacterium]MCY7403741.1 2-succinyl-5-enolpyruvyl-6-hydroxy-3-cyclohexene-1-carboxylic-acid synthase [Cryobacterium sp.]MEC5154141.1 2-succinyl-5-enolpyruvyl-6-hydroxy-3-cyclohexene-1-carboxylate synthase [Cryobacterium sp. CAN_C3]